MSLSRIDSNAIAANAISAADLAESSITTAKLAANAITSAKIEANAVTSLQVAANAITSAKIEANAVTSLQVAANAITSAKIAANVTLQVAAGSNSSPSISVGGDTNTGIYFPAADNIGFATNGVLRGKFLASGNFEINNDILVSSKIYTGIYNFTSGTETVLSLAAGEAVLFYSVMGEYGSPPGSPDLRHGVYYFAGRSFNTTEVKGAQILRLGNAGAFSISGSNVQYNGGGGTPSTSIFYLKIAG